MNGTAEILNAIEKVAGLASRDNKIGLHEPDFSGTKAWEYVRDCLDTGWVCTAGQWVTRFEDEICEQTKAKYAIA